VVSSQPSATLAAINFNNNNGNVRLSLDAANFSAVESVRTELSAVGLVAELQNSSAQGDGVRARLRLREK
jgi:general secretion pathway protein L